MVVIQWELYTANSAVGQSVVTTAHAESAAGQTRRQTIHICGTSLDPAEGAAIASTTRTGHNCHSRTMDMQCHTYGCTVCSLALVQRRASALLMHNTTWYFITVHNMYQQCHAGSSWAAPATAAGDCSRMRHQLLQMQTDSSSCGGPAAAAKQWHFKQLSAAAVHASQHT
jgi:hypothetical protein